MLEGSDETFAQIIDALSLGLDADRAAVVSVGENSQHEILASKPKMKSSAVAPALVDVTAKSRKTVQRVAGGVTIAVTPVIAGQDVPGVLYVQRNRPDGFGPAEVQVLEALAEQIAPKQVSKPARLRRNTIAEALGLADHSSVVWGDGISEPTEAGEFAPYDGVLVAFGAMSPRPPFEVHELQELFADCVEGVIALAKSHVAAVIHGDCDNFTSVAVGATDDAPNVGADDLISRTVVEQVLSTGVPVMTIDARRGALGEVAQSIQQLEITVLTCVPVQAAAGTTVGALYTARFGLGSSFDRGVQGKLVAEAQTLATALDALGPGRGD